MHKPLSSIKRLIELLNDGNYHSGSSIGASMQLTRSMVWKLINQLKAQSIEIASIKGKGYRLMQPIKFLHSQQIKNYISHETCRSKVNIELFDSLPSTNLYLSKASYPSEKILICLAEAQTAGQGRLQRPWHSPFASNIYFSGSWSFGTNISKLAGLSLVIALAIVRMLASAGITQHIHIKWPNDILHQGKKLAGVLIQAMTDTQSMTQAIIGIGINVNMTQDPHAHISQPWTSMQNILGKALDRNFLVGMLINELFQTIELFNAHGLSCLLPEWQHYDYLSGKTIRLNNQNKQIIGQATGINEVGEIMIKHANGKIFSYCAGEATILKAV